jgi:hypothetical protein
VGCLTGIRDASEASSPPPSKAWSSSPRRGDDPIAVSDIWPQSSVIAPGSCFSRTRDAHEHGSIRSNSGCFGHISYPPLARSPLLAKRRGQRKHCVHDVIHRVGEPPHRCTPTPHAVHRPTSKRIAPDLHVAEMSVQSCPGCRADLGLSARSAIDDPSLVRNSTRPGGRLLGVGSKVQILRNGGPQVPFRMRASCSGENQKEFCWVSFHACKG